MVDIKIENVTNVSKTGTFDILMGSINSHISEQYTENRITGTDYATVYLGSIQAALAQSIQFNLQEQLTEAQVDGVLADNLLKAKQLELVTLEISAKQFELDNLLPEQLIKIQEEIDILETQDSEMLLNGEKDRLLKQEQIESEALNNSLDGMIENQIIKIKEEVLVAKEEVEIAKTKTATEQANSIANIDKVLGYNYTLDLDGNIVVGTTTGEGKLDYDKLLVKEQTESEDVKNKVDGILENQILDIKKGVDVKERQMVESELTGTKQRVVLDEEVDTANLQQALVTSQTKTTYTDRILKDKQAAKLGLDNVMKLSESTRVGDPSFIYTPNYEEV